MPARLTACCFSGQLNFHFQPQLNMTPQAQIAAARQSLQAHLNGYLTPAHIAEVFRACDLAEQAHAGVTRKSGEPYITHPIAVAEILADMHLDSEGLQAALLHDVIEDTPYTREQIEAEFGEVVADLVDGLTKLDHLPDKALNQAATFRKIITAILHDPRVLVIKLGDRLHNMSTLGVMRLEKQQRIARETLDFYLPLARLTGLNDLGDPLEVLCWQVLEPESAQRLQTALEQAKAQRAHQRQQRADELIRLARQLGINLSLYPVDNQLHLYRQFIRQQQDLATLLDTHAFVLLTETTADCYALATALISRVDWHEQLDYLSAPLPGGHQALQLSLRDPRGGMLLTLQTGRMQQASRRGLLLGMEAPQATRSAIQAALRNLEDVLDGSCERTTLPALHDYLNQDKIWVYTPDADVRELPLGATAIDFAYAASRYLGQHAVRAEIDGEPASLATVLENGQTVRIHTEPDAQPDPDWLGMVITHRARRAIQQHLRNLNPGQQQAVGRRALDRALRFYQTSLDDVSQQDWADWLDWQQLDNRHALFERIAVGDLLPQLVALRQQQSKAPDAAGQQPVPSPGLISNSQGLDWQFAHCCRPILGDPIIGHLTQRGLIVHRQRCRYMLQEGRRRPWQLIALEWQPDDKADPRFTVPLQIERALSEDEMAEVIDQVNQAKGGVAHIRNQPNQTTLLDLVIRDRLHLANIIRLLRVLLNFPRISRSQA